MVWMYHIKCNKRDIARRVLVFGDPCRTREFSRLLEEPRLVNKNRCLLTYTGGFRGVEITLSTTGMGTPSAAIVSEELAALGAKLIIRVGTTGSISEMVQPGEAVIPTEAIPRDGTTKAYIKKYRIAGIPSADKEIVALLQERARSKGIKAHAGRICTNDTFYLETPGVARYWRGKGALSFEMECATIFAIGSVRGFRAGAILAVTGMAAGDKGMLDDRTMKDAIEACIAAALEAAVQAVL